MEDAKKEIKVIEMTDVEMLSKILGSVKLGHKKLQKKKDDEQIHKLDAELSNL